MCSAAAVQAQDEIKIGVVLGFTGPLETLAPPMAGGAELAIAEVSESGLLLGGSAGYALVPPPAPVAGERPTRSNAATTDRRPGPCGSIDWRHPCWRRAPGP